MVTWSNLPTHPYPSQSNTVFITKDGVTLEASWWASLLAATERNEQMQRIEVKLDELLLLVRGIILEADIERQTDAE